MPGLRPAAVAGRFYPGAPTVLRADVRAYVSDAATPRRSGVVPPKAVIVPHAGYVYSGPVAASAYARILSRRDEITRVVLLGPNHRVPLRAMWAA